MQEAPPSRRGFKQIVRSQVLSHCLAVLALLLLTGLLARTLLSALLLLAGLVGALLLLTLVLILV
jgi:hypothetical protein